MAAATPLPPFLPLPTIHGTSVSMICSLAFNSDDQGRSEACLIHQLFKRQKRCRRVSDREDRLSAQRCRLLHAHRRARHPSRRSLRRNFRIRHETPGLPAPLSQRFFVHTRKGHIRIRHDPCTSSDRLSSFLHCIRREGHRIRVFEVRSRMDHAQNDRSQLLRDLFPHLSELAAYDLHAGILYVCRFYVIDLHCGSFPERFVFLAVRGDPAASGLLIVRFRSLYRSASSPDSP